MAPADRHGYALLPQDDIELAGGPLIVPRVTGKVLEAPRPDEGEELPHDEDHHHKKLVHYDGGRRWDKSTPDCVVHPFNPVVQLWNSALILLLLFDVVVLPVETAFGYAMPKIFMFWFSLSSTVLFSMDIVLQFFLQIPSPCGDFWIFNHWKIMVAYLGGYFAIDLLSVLPFSEIFYLFMEAHFSESSMSNMVSLFRVMRFTKLLRMVRLKRIAKRYEYDLNLTYTQRAAVYCCVVIFLSLHFMSCVWATLGNYQLGYDWESYVKREKSSITGVGFRGEEHPFVQYVIAMYFSIYTLTGIGYGDIVAITWLEHVFAVAIMFMGSLIWATIIGEIVSVLNNAHVDEVEYQDTADRLLVMGRTFGLDRSLIRRLKMFISQQRSSAHRTFIHDKVMSKMSPELAIQLTHVLHSGWFKDIWWLKNVCHSFFMVELTLAMETALYCPQEHIRATDRLHVIVHGIAIHGSQILSKNKCFGMDFLLTQEHLRLNVATVALSYLHTMYLTRDALQHTLQRHPQEHELVRRSYRSLCLMRGIVYYAKQVLAEEKRQAELNGERVEDAPKSRRKTDFLTRMASMTADEEAAVVGPSEALATRASAREVTNSIEETRAHLERIEDEITHRMDTVETQVNMAMELISDFIARHSRERR